MSGKVWRIRYEGQPINPRYRVHKRRTAAVKGSKEDAEQVAADLEKYQGVKILWIREWSK